MTDSDSLGRAGDSFASVPISAVIIVRDAELTIENALKSLARLSEVVLYDNGSSDRTIEIARRYPNVVVMIGPFTGFGPTRNQAAALAGNDWILSLDADESVSPELMDNLANANLSDAGNAYAIHRRNFFMGREVRFSGWGDDWLVRLYNRRSTSFDEALVHEKVLPPSGGKVQRLQGSLRHDAVRQVGDFLVKVNRYSDLRRVRQPAMNLIALILLRSFWAFFRTLIFRLGFLDGWRGVVIAFSDANGVFFKYIKPYAEARTRDEAALTQSPSARDTDADDARPRPRS